MQPQRADPNTALPTQSAAVKPKYRRRVVMLKPLVETPAAPPQPSQYLSKLRLLRHDSDTSSSPDFSPTSVLPYSKHQGTFHKAGQSQLHRALTASSISSPAGSPPESSPPAVTARQQPSSTESWTSRHFVYDIKPAAQPMLAPQPPAHTSRRAATAVPMPHKPAPPPAKQAKHSTLEAAWRWRFKRQWRRAQAQALMHDPNDPSNDQADDPWHMALDMIQAGNAFPEVGVPVPDHDCYSGGPAASPLLDADDDIMDELFELEQDPAESASEAASKPRPALAEAASKARELFKHQANVERYHQKIRVQDTRQRTFSSAFLPLHSASQQGQPPSWNAQGAPTQDPSKPQEGNPKPMGMHTSISSHMLAAGIPRRSDSAASLGLYSCLNPHKAGDAE